MKTKAPLPYIKDRSSQTSAVMLQLADNPPNWTAPNFISPQNFKGQLDEIQPQENKLSLREAQLAVAAGEWDSLLEAWHDEAVTVLALARPLFRDTAKAPAWRAIRAGKSSRETVAATGRYIIAAWQASNAAWVPKPALTLAAFTARQTAATAKAAAHSAAETLVDVERGILHDQANNIYDLSVQWYELATGYFAPGTLAGSLIRTIPTAYNPNEAPGQLHFQLRFSPSPNSVQLGWNAPRGEHYNIYALAPGAAEFVKILDNVTQTSWQGQGLSAGQWAFKGEATNAAGAGPQSEVIVVPVHAAMAA